MHRLLDKDLKRVAQKKSRKYKHFYDKAKKAEKVVESSIRGSAKVFDRAQDVAQKFIKPALKYIPNPMSRAMIGGLDRLEQINKHVKMVEKRYKKGQEIYKNITEQPSNVLLHAKKAVARMDLIKAPPPGGD